MKRAHELELAVVEIVREGKARDEEGNLIHPVMQEPAVMAFFGAPDALFDVLRERPLLVLNLLQVNKALEVFWNRFEGIWPLLIDFFVEKEMGAYAADIYPFIVFQQHKKYARRDAMFVGSQCESGGLRAMRLEMQQEASSSVLYVVYYDAFTRLYIDFLHAVDMDEKWHYHLSQYFNRDDDYGNKMTIAAYTDCFVIGMSRGTPIDAIAYNTNRLEQTFSLIVRIYNLSEKARGLLVKLRALIKGGDAPDAPVLLKLDKSTAAPYRTLLYDKGQGLFKTPLEQKDFFVSVLRDLMSNIPSMDRREDADVLIVKYGTPLRCAFCHCETHSVDPLLMRAFCTESCRTIYSQQ